VDGIADLVTVHFPWGSLLRGVIGQELSVASRLAGLVKPGGNLRLLVSAAERDRRSGLAVIEPEEVVAAWLRLGFRAIACRPATPAAVAASRSTWAKRLGSRSDRAVWLIELCRV
jgi:16S rRNA (adenine(1408)-N(1))-methyltransferase